MGLREKKHWSAFALSSPCQDHCIAFSYLSVFMTKWWRDVLFYCYVVKTVLELLLSLLFFCSWPMSWFVLSSNVIYGTTSNGQKWLKRKLKRKTLTEGNDEHWQMYKSYFWHKLNLTDLSRFLHISDPHFNEKNAQKNLFYVIKIFTWLYKTCQIQMISERNLT